jgi:hypothetical protein
VARLLAHWGDANCHPLMVSVEVKVVRKGVLLAVAHAALRNRMS